MPRIAHRPSLLEWPQVDEDYTCSMIWLPMKLECDSDQRGELRRNEQRKEFRGEGAGRRSDSPCLRGLPNARSRATGSSAWTGTDGNCCSPPGGSAGASHSSTSKRFRRSVV